MDPPLRNFSDIGHCSSFEIDLRNKSDIAMIGFVTITCGKNNYWNDF